MKKNRPTEREPEREDKNTLSVSDWSAPSLLLTSSSDSLNGRDQRGRRQTIFVQTTG